MVFGGVIGMISFMGCCGACKNVRCLLGFYSSFLLLLLVIEIGVGIFVGVFTPFIKELISPFLELTIQYQYMGDMYNRTIISVVWDEIMYNVNLLLMFIL